MILVSGFNVYPNELEDVLCSFPGVLEAAVVGVPDDKSGEAVKAYLVMKEPCTEEAIRAHCKQFLTAYKILNILNLGRVYPNPMWAKYCAANCAARLNRPPKAGGPRRRCC